MHILMLGMGVAACSMMIALPVFAAGMSLKHLKPVESFTGQMFL